MAISAQCPHCHISLNLRDEMAGRMVRCRCGKPFKVPEPSSGSALEDLLNEELSRPYEAPSPREAPRREAPRHQPPSSQPSRSSSANPYGPPARGGKKREPRNSPFAVWLLFSFEGRIPRRWYWAVAVVFNILYVIFLVNTMPEFPAPGQFPQPAAEQSVIMQMVSFIFWVFFMWVGLAVQVKRWHDRDKSGWMILIVFIPLIGPIWAFVEVGCLRGTHGQNDFGDDPT